ncbi:HAD family hydrolase [uncultured Roseibium sp.]|uniref:HAD family hydrolase n=1 Tax=uncultured Roseibium sp. TaxID=1936171 RepID=UPI00261BC736|nr:HAD family hydrolase [uncultured Roseibium sp.]
MSEAPDESEPWLLVCDVDDTLTGNREDLRKLWQALKKRRKTLKLALNSSRPWQSVDETISTYFPEDFEPEAIITGLGTEIRLRGAWLDSWQKQFKEWPDRRVRKLVTDMGYAAHSSAYQTCGKASFEVAGIDAVQGVLNALTDQEIPFRSVHSGTSDLDILAPGAGKDTAMMHLAGILEVATSHTIAAGDSGNDLALFNAAGKAIAVGNARSELIAAMPTEKTFHAIAPHAAGVMEGLIEFGLLTKEEC